MKNVQVALDKLLDLRRSIAALGVAMNVDRWLRDIDNVRTLLSDTLEPDLYRNVQKGDVGNGKTVTLEKKPNGRYVVTYPTLKDGRFPGKKIT